MPMVSSFGSVRTRTRRAGGGNPPMAPGVHTRELATPAQAGISRAFLAPCGWSRNGAARPGDSRQSASIQAAVLNRLAHVLGLEIRRAVEIGNRARNLENPVIRPRRQRQSGDRRAEQ